MFQPDWLILRILHQSFEIERPKGYNRVIDQRSWYIYTLLNCYPVNLYHLNHVLNKLHVLIGGVANCVDPDQMASSEAS